jgi:hypothetical protein
MPQSSEVLQSTHRQAGRLPNLPPPGIGGPAFLLAVLLAPLDQDCAEKVNLTEYRQLLLLYRGKGQLDNYKVEAWKPFPYVDA